MVINSLAERSGLALQDGSSDSAHEKTDMKGTLPMRNIIRSVRLSALVVASTAAFAQPKGVLLADLTWQEAEKVLKPDTVVVIPLGGEAKEHGPHMLLNIDYVQTEYVKKQILERANVVVAPTINYSYYPAFVDYPGSTSLTLETARDMVVEICRGLARFGPRRFYVINMGVSTALALKPAAEILGYEGILLTFKVEHRDQPGNLSGTGTHANQEETSNLLYIDPAHVDMSKAVDDYHPSITPGVPVLTRDPHNPGVYSVSGVYGFATRATREEGERNMKGYVESALKDIEDLRKSGTHK